MILRTQCLARRAIGVVVAAALVCAGGATVSRAGASSHRRLGSISHVALNRPIVGMAATPSGNGYWLVAADGGVFTFGDAHFHGSTGKRKLAAPIVGITATRTSNGYWLAAADGRVFTFGDAHFHGGARARRAHTRIAGIAATRSGDGYWLAAANGHVFSFGDANNFGSISAHVSHPRVVGISVGKTGNGYWLATTNGTTYAFGNAHVYSTAFRNGSRAVASAANAVVGIAGSPTGGYWVASRRGTVGVSELRSAAPVAARAAPRAVAEPALTNAPLIAVQLALRMNTERVARHLKPVAWDALLAQRAAMWARTLLTTNSFHHQNLAIVANAAKGRFGEVGENLFSGTGAAADAGSAHVALMNSTEHRENILLPQGQFVGIAAACFHGKLMIVEDFAIKMGAPMPPAGQGVAPANPIVASDPRGAGC